MTAGFIAQTICNPLDVLKVRLQADGQRRLYVPSAQPHSTGKASHSIHILPRFGKEPRYRNARHALGVVWEEGGARGMYKGVCA
jgi:hypothetical protein